MNYFIPRLEQFQLFTKTETFKRGSLGTKIVDEASSWPVVTTYVTEPTAEGLWSFYTKKIDSSACSSAILRQIYFPTIPTLPATN